MSDLFDKMKEGKEKWSKYRAENEEAKKKASLPFMIFHNSFSLLVVIAYVLMGVLANLWHPGWIVFLVIPFYYLTVECVKHKSPATFPIAILVTGVYLLLGFLGGMWHPHWLLFAIVPLYYAVVSVMKGGSVLKWVSALFPVFIAGVYLLIGFLANAWHPGWVVFFAIPLYYSVVNTIRRYRYGEKQDKKEEHSDDDVINIK